MHESKAVRKQRSLATPASVQSAPRLDKGETARAILDRLRMEDDFGLNDNKHTENCRVSGGERGSEHFFPERSGLGVRYT